MDCRRHTQRKLFNNSINNNNKKWNESFRRLLWVKVPPSSRKKKKKAATKIFYAYIVACIARTKNCEIREEKYQVQESTIIHAENPAARGSACRFLHGEQAGTGAKGHQAVTVLPPPPPPPPPPRLPPREPRPGDDTLALDAPLAEETRLAP